MLTFCVIIKKRDHQITVLLMSSLTEVLETLIEWAVDGLNLDIVANVLTDRSVGDIDRVGGGRTEP